MLKLKTLLLLLFLLNLVVVPFFLHSSWEQIKIEEKEHYDSSDEPMDQDSFLISEIVDDELNDEPRENEPNVLMNEQSEDQVDFDAFDEDEIDQPNLFDVLGAYPPLTFKYLNTYPTMRIFYNQTDHALINDDDYCKRVDQYNIKHPENMFEQINSFSDYGGQEMGRDIVELIGKDTMPQISIFMNRTDFQSRKYHLAPEITNYFTKRVDFHLYHEIGKNFLCATQMYNHIPGHGVIKRKDLIVGTIKRYSKDFLHRPHCFDKDKFFPLSYRLYDKQECKTFFKIITSTKYELSLKKEPIQYLLKVGFGSHKAAGVNILDKETTQGLLAKYENGTRCGEVFESYVAQSYIWNPLLLDRHNKFDFRVYMLIASTNPLIVYSHDGFLRVSLTSYNKSSNDKGTHLTNTYLSMMKLEDLKEGENKFINGMTEEEAKKYVLWDLNRLQRYLMGGRKIKDPNWLENYLRPAFRKAFVHVARMSRSALWNQSNVYELFGLDFMLDNKLNLWLLECNSSPQLLEDNGKEFMTKMLVDMFNIQYSYYRSRMKRVLEVLKNMELEKERFGYFEDLKKWETMYQQAVKNRLEPEYALSEDNSWKIVMDENLPGAAAYYGHVANECV